MTRAVRSLYVGAGAWSGETGKIQRFELDLERGALSLRQELDAGGVAAFMARSSDGRHLYVADETKGSLASYAIAQSGELSLTSHVACAGHPVYVSLDPSGRSLATCFFQEAKTQIFAINPDGTLGQSAFVADSGRESHSTVFDPSGRFLFVPTRGDNWIAQYRFDADSRSLVSNQPERVVEDPGAGPRHLAFHPNGRFAYLVNELTLSLSVYAFDSDSGTLRSLQRSIPAAPSGKSGGAAADIHIHPNGCVAYLSNRQDAASNIAIFALDPESGAATLVGHESTRGRTPRNFALDRDGTLLIAGNQDSAELAIFRIARAGLALEYVRSVPVAPGPFFLGIY